MARDPVCGMYVNDENPAFTAEVDRRTYYFCSEACMLTFVQPEKERQNLKRLVYFSLTLGVVALSPNLVSLDAVLCGLIRIDPEKVGYLKKGEEEFGPYDRDLVKKARAVSSDWFPVD